MHMSGTSRHLQSTRLDMCGQCGTVSGCIVMLQKDSGYRVLVWPRISSSEPFTSFAVLCCLQHSEHSETLHMRARVCMFRPLSFFEYCNSVGYGYEPRYYAAYQQRNLDIAKAITERFKYLSGACSAMSYTVLENQFFRCCPIASTLQYKIILLHLLSPPTMQIDGA